ncbi:MAG: SH3 domain-containing protein [Anaerolineae bacterium]|nr:SH3 domain-containing protein [Anaerolineae bacterium]
MTPLKFNVTADMLTADYWLARLADPDTPLLDAGAITAFNAQTRATLAIPDVLDLPETLDAGDVRALLPSLPDGPLYGIDGALIDLGALKAAAALPARLSVRLGLAARRTHLRAFPTDRVAMKRPGDFYFDRFQDTTVDVGWPVAVFHTEIGGEWHFAFTPAAAGWLRAGDIALADDPAAVHDYVNAPSFVTVTGSRAGVVLPGGRYVFAQMGTRLPLAGRDADTRRLWIPQREHSGKLTFIEGHIAAADPDWHEGAMPCTLRTVFTQAFKLLGEPYAWGGSRMGMFGRDCSRFVQDVWAVTGVRLPRNSAQQGRVGINAAAFGPDDTPAARAAILRNVPPGALLWLPGHIMLYLGSVDGVPYAIHDVWRYTHPDGAETPIRRVAVTDLPVAPAAHPTLMTRLVCAQVIGPV